VCLGALGIGFSVEPIPETAVLLEEFGEFYDGDLLDELKSQAKAVRMLVPDLVGLSLAAFAEGVAFTLVASAADVAVLDAVQYVMGGPCVESPQAEQVLEYDCDVPEEELRWQTFARATAAVAVATTLTLPVLIGGRVVGTVNLYAASAGAFRGLHREIAEIFGAWAPGAITNADLSFRTRRTAEQAPEKARAAMRVNLAVGMLMEARSVDATTARELLDEAAQRAGVAVEELAESLVDSRQDADET
jgi:GAF domain-containing protein